MPILQAKNLDVISTFAAMASAISYPSDESKQSFIIKGSTKYVVSSFASAGLIKFAPEDQHQLIKIVGSASKFPLKLDKLVERFDPGRRLAGEILEVAMALHRYAPKHASLEKTNPVLQWRHNGTDLPTSRASLKAAWREYKSIAPLQLAFKLRMPALEQAFRPFGETVSDKSFEEEMVIDSDEAMSDEDLQELNEIYETQQAYLKERQCSDMSQDEKAAFLTNEFGECAARFFVEYSRLQEEMMIVASYARQIGIDATQVYAHGRRAIGKPLLDPSDMWRFPENFETKPVEVPYPPLTQMDMAALGIS
ncbi:MAG: hypothetical protein HZA67_03945 [Rhodospirillales bacterium]|nr:hypothetical protein [Rhodospirillales bacterium]